MTFLNDVKVQIKVNPTNYPQLPIKLCISAAGKLMGWLPVVVSFGEDKLAMQFLNDVYPFGIYEMEGGTIDDDGVLSFPYPEDPDLIPLVYFENVETNKKAYVYKYGICAWQLEDNSFFITRMD